MLKKVFLFVSICALAFSISGCATCSKEKDMESQGLRNQIAVLEAQINSKDNQIAVLKETLQEAEDSRPDSGAPVIGEVKSRPTVKQIQTALLSAGYNPGPLDGKTGRQTQDAIKAFQQANGLKADGKVGKKTWAVLEPYLYKKVK